MTAEPIPVRELRYRCPFCGRPAGRPSRVREHMTRCWLDPANRSCKTCVNFERMYGDYGDTCALGVDLSGHSACSACNGVGFYPDGMDLGGPCPECDNDPQARDALKPGPIIHCDQWQARREYAEAEDPEKKADEA
jgi:hypothetical protein